MTPMYLKPITKGHPTTPTPLTASSVREPMESPEISYDAPVTEKEKQNNMFFTFVKRR